jgi:hypothetical protein
MPAWLSAAVPWIIAVWCLGTLIVVMFLHTARSRAAASMPVEPEKKPPAKPYEGTWEDQMRAQRDRQRDRNFDLSMRVYELETENKRLAFELRCYRCLESVRACKGRFDTLQKAAENGMGC